ncbi:MAG: aminopeptidase P family protein [Bacteroidales bacterium]|jgi:Xaa-Pro aminopeptidase|nr:aminopeptidase P family protein [Bacteroidales bacterium]MCI1733086.1 aminopeptidase P family protein [Bacteroidales bacterium]
MFTKAVYAARRQRLAKDVAKGIILILGNSDAPSNYPDNCYTFRQDSNFLYFFGLNDPDLAAVIDAETGEEIIFGNDVSIDDIIWMGPQASIADKAASVGVKKSRKYADLQKYLTAAKKAKKEIHFTPPYRYHNMILLNSLLGLPIDSLKKKASVTLIKAIVAQRIVKDKYEIEEIDKACNIGYAMHFTAMKLAKLGMLEQELAGLMDGIAMQHGSKVSFPTILSQNGETLHNHLHNQILTKDRLIVIDAGAENNMNYCSDNTRTIPSSGKFTQQQKEIYNIVSDANNLAFKLSKPGVAYLDVHLAVYRLFAERLKELGLMKGDVDEAVANGAPALFMPHGLGHNMGLDVHDMEDLGEDYVGYGSAAKRNKQFGLASLRMARKLVPGNVVTDEPGIYFIPALIEKWKKEKINASFINFSKLKDYYHFGGIRLEDDVLITPDGCRLLGAKRLPITVKDVEREMKDNNK